MNDQASPPNFDQSVPPNWAPTAAAPPPPQPGAPQFQAYPQAPYHPQAAGAAQYPHNVAPPNVDRRGARPAVPVGSALMVLGGVLAIVSAFLPWVSAGGTSRAGFDTYIWLSGFSSTSLTNPGGFVVIGAAIMVGLGIAQLLARRLAAVSIIGVISGALGILGGAGLLLAMNGYADFVDGSIGIGAILLPLTPIISIVGAGMALAKKPARQTW